MSVRAYRVLVPAKTDSMPMFNLWHHQAIYHFIFDHEDTVSRMEDGAGSFETSTDCLAELVSDMDKHPEKYVDEAGGQEEYKALKEYIRDIYDDETRKKNTYVDFECH